jgi:hypothetical protein
MSVQELVLHSFGAGYDGAVPYRSLIDVGGKLNGTTSGGGTPRRRDQGGGTVYRGDPESHGGGPSLGRYALDAKSRFRDVGRSRVCLSGLTLAPRPFAW